MIGIQNVSAGVKRDPFWDALKFALIFLVVYGHIVILADTSSYKVAMFNFIYLFHMPLFVFVSGRFSQIHDRKRYLRSIWRFLKLLLVFQILYVLLFEQLSLEQLVIPNYHLWYLLSLAFWRLMIYTCPNRLLAQRSLVVFACFAISLLAGFINVGEPFSLQRTLTHLPFFMLGYYTADIDFKKYVDRIPFLVAVSVLFVVFCLFFFVLQDSYSYVFYGSIPYWAESSSETLNRFWGRCLFLPSTLLVGLLVMRVVPANTTYAKWGVRTMFVYIWHPLVTRGILEPATASGLIPKSDFMLLAYAVVVTALMLFLSRFRVLKP